jgi:hypothetical protein
MLQFRASLTDDTSIIIYDCKTFIIQATGHHWGYIIKIAVNGDFEKVLKLSIEKYVAGWLQVCA